jgi:phytoene/squalene synthetase
MAILKAIRRIDYNVWQKRPTVSKTTKLGLLLRAWWNTK